MEIVLSMSTKENHAATVKRKMAMVFGAVKAGVPARPDVNMVLGGILWKHT